MRTLAAVSRRTIVALALLIGSSWAIAAPPGGGSSGTTMPPVTPNFDLDAFEYRPDLGGWLDTTTNLVWGYSLYGASGSNYSFGGAATAVGSYATLLANQADWAAGRAEYYELRGDQETALGNLARAAQAYALADAYAEDAIAYDEAAADAGQYSNWRIPTVNEARAVVARGLFSTGPSGLNGWTRSPADDVPTGVVSAWSSTTASKKNTAWAYSPANGAASAVSTTSSIDAIVVRTHTP